MYVRWKLLKINVSEYKCVDEANEQALARPTDSPLQETSIYQETIQENTGTKPHDSRPLSRQELPIFPAQEGSTTYLHNPSSLTIFIM